MKSHEEKVGIIGAGIAGLTLGCTLLQNGIPAIIFEQSSKVSSYGAGISLSQNALCLLDRLNILANLEERSRSHSKVIFQGPKKNICELNTPFKIITSRRQELINCLLERYINHGGEILYNHSLKKFNQSNNKIKFHNNNEYSVIHLAACDGIRSSIRDNFFTNQQPKYSGYSAWRGVGSSDLQWIHFVLGPKSHIVNYPLNKEGDVSFVAVKKEEGKFSESWREEGTYNSFLNDFALYDPAIFPTIENSQKLYKWGIYVRPPLKSMIGENITLLGDAAHPMVPFLGQGGCMAIEDAYSFGILCKKAEGDFQKAQNVYDSIRNKRTKLIQRLSRRQANIYHMQNPILVAARNVALKFSFIPIYELKNIHTYDAHNYIVKNRLKF